MSKLKLPCPRLEFKWAKKVDSWNLSICVYSLVLPLVEYDIRAEDEKCNRVREELSIKIGETEVTGGGGKPPIYSDGTVHTPYRDSAHANFDNDALGGHLPIVAVCGDTFTLIKE